MDDVKTRIGERPAKVANEILIHLEDDESGVGDIRERIWAVIVPTPGPYSTIVCARFHPPG